MNDFCIFTIISKNYISQARVLMKSFLKFHPGVKTFVLLADKADGYFVPEEEPFTVIEADSLGIEDFDSFSFKYNIVEFNTAVKPFFFDYLFSVCGFRKVVYLDPDILIMRALSGLFEKLDKYSIVITPHIMSPLPDDGCSPKDIDILKGGIFNLGFIALAKSGSSDRLLSWWKDRLYDKCLQAPISGYAVDQVWMSLIPCFFDDYFVLKEPGYNVAYWNLHERSIAKKDGQYYINDEPLYFFHFSGIDPNNLDNISKYQNRFRAKDITELGELFETYKSRLMENGYYESVKWPYYYGYFKNGTRISDFVRAMYWGSGANSRKFGNPFDTFYRNLLKSHNISSLFSERFLRAMANRLFMYLWKLSLKKRGH
jgi:hypothetical protein